MNKKDEPRVKLINIKVTDEEREELKARADAVGLTVSDYLRQLAGLKSRKER